MAMKLYVGNLSFQTSSQDLEELFAGIGTVESATVVEDRETGRSRGFGFVEMASQEEGEKAIAELNGQEVSGREIKVNEAKPREDPRRPRRRWWWRLRRRFESLVGRTICLYVAFK